MEYITTPYGQTYYVDLASVQVIEVEGDNCTLVLSGGVRIPVRGDANEWQAKINAVKIAAYNRPEDTIAEGSGKPNVQLRKRK